MILKREKGEISKEEWIQCVESHEELVWEADIRKYLTSNHYLSAYFKINGSVYSRLFFHGNRIDVGVEDQFFCRVLPVLRSINKFLKTDFYKEDFLNDNKNAYTFEEIKTLKEIGLKNKIDISKRYHDYSFGDHSEWMTLKTTDINSVLNYFKIENHKLVDWDRAFVVFKNLEPVNILFIFSFREWTFIIGRIEKNLLLNKSQKSFDSLVLELETLSQQFEEAHYYSHWYKWASHNAFFKAVKGKLVFGKYSSEETNFEKGEKPEILNLLTSLNAYDVAYIWSLDPRYFAFEKELKEAKVTVFY